MVVSSGHQSAIFSYSSNQVGGNALNSWHSITHYFKLAEANEQLAAENIALRKQLKTSFIDRDKQTFNFLAINTQTDSLAIDSLSRTFDFISSKVVSNTIHKQKNYLILNKGLRQGVKKNMGVIGSHGVVGIVYSVSKDYCTVISLINIKTRISAKLLSNNELGSLQWNGEKPNIAQLTSIETYIPISKGDTIITSGYSHIFPEGILLGTIDNYYIDNNKNTYHIDVQLSTHFSSLQYVSIIRNKYYNELMLLEKSKEDEK